MVWEGNKEWEWDQTDEVGLTRFVIFSKDSKAVADFINSAKAQEETFEHDIDKAIAEGNLPPRGYDFHINTPQRCKLIKAIYNALSRKGLNYDRPNDPSFSNPNQPTQLIPTPEKLFHDNVGTCLDLSILFCAICWYYDLLPILILTNPSGDGGEGHAFVAVSLTHRGRDWDKVNRKGQQIFKCKGLTNKSQDLSELKKGHYLVVECTGFARSTTLSDNDFQRNSEGLLTFQQATDLGRKKLDNAANNGTLKVAIDIAHSGYKKYWWNGLFSDRLKIENEKSSNPITTNNRPISELYVEPKLSKRPHTEHLRPIRQEDQVLATTTEEATKPDREVETEEINYDTFLQQLFNPQLMEKSEGKRLAIIGEPGSGKTVLLLNIAEWILNQRGEFPILISLAKLDIKQLENDHGLKEYLVNTLLPKNAKEETAEEYKEPFEELLKSGRFCLLLDGVNEMATEDRNASYPLAKISDQLADKEVWGQVRVVVTCRLNEWEHKSNNLVGTFNTFRLLNYKYPDDVNKFISNWFQDNQDKGNSLINKIVESDRLKDLAKNPLRLALLCYISGNSLRSQQLNLINKTTLYELAEEAYYARKKNDPSARFDLSDIQRCKLRNLLRNLSKSALEKESSPFCLDQKFLDHFFEREEHKDELVLLPLVKDFWLNNIGQSRKGQDIYTFFHPSFQEYFASQAIDDWDYFLPKEHTEDKAKIKKIPPQIPGGDYKPYRIFESKWKEVILLWMGREVDNAFRTKKEKFLKHLVEFQDGWENFYSYRAYFLAAEVIAEFKDYDKCRSSEIVNQVVEWSLDIFNDENKKQSGETFTLPIRQAAIDVLQRTDRDLVIQHLKRIKKKLKSTVNQSELDREKYEQVVKILNYFERDQPYDYYDEESQIPPSEIVITDNTIKEIIVTAQELLHPENHPVFWQAIERLGEIGKGNQEAIYFLINVFDRSEGNQYLHLKSALHLAAIGISDFTTNLIALATSDNAVYSNNNATANLIEIIATSSGDIEQFLKLIVEDSIKCQLILFLMSGDIQQFLNLLKSYIANNHDFWEKFIDADPVLCRLLPFYNQLTAPNDTKKLIEEQESINKLKNVAEKLKTLGEYKKEKKYKSTFEELKKLLPDDDSYRQMIRFLKEYLSNKREQEIVIPSYTKEQRDELQNLGIADYLYQTGEPSERFRDCYKTLWYCAQVMPYPEFYSAFNPESK